MAKKTEEGAHMDMAEHERTWSAFVTFTKWGTISVALVLILMALFLL
ncbi:MAG: aa3-type cytochrome c oxidase subunit IV [Alphaproteobacteria bacterium]|nr:aa3-type cytochrome c oxidase subunit IV [Alphaproteobacteria bacterium]MDX5368136.1 aa3-type cytochrome c oxidase subunit IV [Alphaproteobacteria bacterium]MDX5462967.1 aa3-type cytochrome c oxidase subunit IV [Alphaproteobacteria bacterium]